MDGYHPGGHLLSQVSSARQPEGKPDSLPLQNSIIGPKPPLLVSPMIYWNLEAHLTCDQVQVCSLSPALFSFLKLATLKLLKKRGIMALPPMSVTLLLMP